VTLLPQQPNGQRRRASRLNVAAKKQSLQRRGHKTLRDTSYEVRRITVAQIAMIKFDQ
jgi:hypothetical protein